MEKNRGTMNRLKPNQIQNNINSNKYRTNNNKMVINLIIIKITINKPLIVIIIKKAMVVIKMIKVNKIKVQEIVPSRIRCHCMEKKLKKSSLLRILVFLLIFLFN